MNFIKKYLKLIIGIAVLIFVLVVFSFSQRGSDLEVGNMKNWIGASLERRAAAVKILTGSDENTDLLVQCVDKIAALPNAGEMEVRDAAALCYTGMQLKDNL